MATNAEFSHEQSLLVTGGTGSFGRAFVERCLGSSKVRKIIVFSRDEVKQQELRNRLGGDARLRFFLGDVRDRERLALAMYGIDTVIHAAALKQVDTAERNPSEAVKTNIFGTENVIHAAIECGVANLVALSTDKASSPVNLYGATKLAADRLVIAGNHYAAGKPRPTRMSVVRYGNVMGSRGSVVPLFTSLAEQGKPLPVTDPRMTRFWIEIHQAVNFVAHCLSVQQGGELFVPKIPSIRITDLVKAVDPHAPIEVVGRRPGEKLHEEMISVDEAVRTFDLGEYFVVCPEISDWGFTYPPGSPVAEFFRYASDTNDQWLSPDEIRASILAHNLAQGKP